MADSQLNDNANTFQYRPLESLNDEIRLLKLVPESGKLQGVIVHASLRDPPSYDALSYAWQDSTIFVDAAPGYFETLHIGDKVIRIGRNLKSFLDQAVSDTDQFCDHIWIDAISINQSDLQERNEQVLRMREIYQCARTVIIWLGPHTGDSRLAMKFLCEIGDRTMANQASWYTKQPEGFEAAVTTEAYWTKNDSEWIMEELKTGASHTKWTALLHILDRNWWQRTWTVQEVVMAETAMVLCGTNSIGHQVFSDVMFVLQMLWTWLRIALNDAGIESQPTGISTAYQAFYLRNRRKFNGFPTTLQLITATRNKLTTDNRDKLYGVLGLASDASSVVPAPDYTVSVLDVFKQYTVSMIEANQNLDVLCLAGGINAGHSFPTWCPCLLPGIDLRQTINPATIAYGQVSPQPYRAADNSKPCVRFSENLNVMHTKGYRLDVIDGLGCAWSPDGSTTSMAQSEFQATMYPTEEENFVAIWQTLVGGFDRFNHPIRLAPDTFGVLFACRSRFLDALREEEQPDGSYQSAGFDQWYKDNKNFRICGRTIKQWCEAASVPLFDEGFNDPPTQHRLWPYFERNVRGVQKRRRIITTVKGFVGMAPEEAIPGDLITVLSGGSMPLVLRRRDDHFHLVGECYLHGAMNGETVNGLKDGMPVEEEFELH